MIQGIVCEMKPFQGKKIGSSNWGTCTVCVDKITDDLHICGTINQHNEKKAWDVEYQSHEDNRVKFKLYHGNMVMSPPPVIGDDITIE